jgi:hypothetical protein
MAESIAFFVVLFLCVILDLIFFPVICSFQDVSEWKLRKIVKDLMQAQKRNSFYDDVKEYTFRLPSIQMRHA